MYGSSNSSNSSMRESLVCQSDTLGFLVQFLSRRCSPTEKKTQMRSCCSLSRWVYSKQRLINFPRANTLRNTYRQVDTTYIYRSQNSLRILSQIRRTMPSLFILRSGYSILVFSTIVSAQLSRSQNPNRGISIK